MPGSSSRCHTCSGGNRGSGVGFLSALLVLALFVTVLAVSYLLERVGDGANEAQNRPRRWWKRTVSSIRTLPVKAIPLCAITIVVVVLQIVIQVRAITYSPRQTPFGGVLW